MDNNGAAQFSLLAPEGEHTYYDIGDITANDLSIDFLTEKLGGNTAERKIIRKILTEMPVEESVIKYRQEVYSELRADTALCERLYEIFDKMSFYVKDRYMKIDEGSAVFELLTRLKSLESYIISILELKETIGGREFVSEGMKKFAAAIAKIYENSGFEEFLEDISIIREEISDVRSITIGVNLNRDYYPEETGIISLNTYHFGEQNVLSRFLKYHRGDCINDDKDLVPFSMEIHDDSLNRAFKKASRFLDVNRAINATEGIQKVEFNYHRAMRDNSASDSPLMKNLNVIIERMLPELTGKLKKVLNKYVDISGRALVGLADEFLFFLRFIQLEKMLEETGIPCCTGKLSGGDTVMKDFYNVKLALCCLDGTVSEDIVYNDIEFTDDKAVWILTGPNRGGKTIITQGIGLAFLLYQSGVFVPASEAEIRPCSGIYTHFPVEEERTVSLGRLGEESERFHEICRSADSSSLMLCNESFATTSHSESLYIAEDVLKYLCCAGIRTCFNTHMHELAENAEKFGSCENARCKAVSVVMDNDNGKRSYKIAFKKPDGKSYAHEIACKYGITFEQLSEFIK